VFVDLNNDFVNDINNAITNEQSYFVIGGTVGQLPTAIPEPASWALMIVGFLGTGVALRARRRAALA
ncbi:MAG TPA: PEPxxWA-CTERM sorting domain-containing protein, partial [Phenylobacterium sp.]|nr:PEPxxWA-CTERM sorting domain-containing protein [Phenylobacterium sp.]